jgi:Flp pilus assembly protein TadD
MDFSCESGLVLMVNRLLRKNQHACFSVCVFDFGVCMPFSFLHSVCSRTLPILMLVPALALGACQSRQAKLDADPMSTSSTASLPKAADVGSFTRTEALSKKWAANQSDAGLGLEFADNLGKMGQTDQQIEILKTVAATHPSDGALQSKVGKQILAAGRAGEAILILDRATKAPGADWKTFSALGSAYDQQGNHEQARGAYQSALNLKPNELTVENNMAMSYVLEGKLPEAEKILRAAVAQPGVDLQPRVRQNLALVVGLQGHFDEARKIASEDLPPDQVEANLAYLQQMLAQPNTWAQLQDPPKS